MATHEGLHEAAGDVLPETTDRHRALASIGEELEAVDWYAQRIDAAHDGELKAILAHNRDEEKEHAAMVLEWLRRRDPEFSTFLRKYLFTSGSIVGREAAGKGGEDEATPMAPAGGSLGIGSLKASAGGV